MARLLSVGENARLAASEAISHVKAAVIPVYRLQDGPPELAGDPAFVGSGVLLRLGSDRFLATAAHVLDEVQDTPVVALDGQLVPLSQRPLKTRSPDAGRAGDRLDFGVVPLTDAEVSRLPADGFVDHDAINYDSSVSKGAVVHAIVGFPGTTARTHWAVRTARAERNYWISRESKAEIYTRAKVSPKEHLLIGWDTARIRRTARRWRRSPLPGMSGAGIWRVNVLNPYSAVARPSLAALFIEQAKEVPCLIGIRLWVLMINIARHFPGVERYLPGRLQGLV